MNKDNFEDDYYLKYLNQDLTVLHTKQLISILRRSLRRDPQSPLSVQQEQTIVDFQQKLKTELSKREHVPNKKEAKKIRQEKFKR